MHYMESLALTYGPVHYLAFGPSVAVQIADPAMIRALYISCNDAASVKWRSIRSIFSLMGDGLVLASGQLWARQRHRMNPAFRPGEIRVRSSQTVVLRTEWPMDGMAQGFQWSSYYWLMSLQLCPSTQV